MNSRGELSIIVFSCSFGWGYLGEREHLIATIPNWLPIACCGKIETELLLEAFSKGADGVLILACPRNDCHFQDGGNQLYKRVQILTEFLSAHGIGPHRLELLFASDPDGETISQLIADFSRRLELCHEKT